MTKCFQNKGAFGNTHLLLVPTQTWHHPRRYETNITCQYFPVYSTKKAPIEPVNINSCQ